MQSRLKILLSVTQCLLSDSYVPNIPVILQLALYYSWEETNSKQNKSKTNSRVSGDEGSESSSHAAICVGRGELEDSRRGAACVLEVEREAQ